MPPARRWIRMDVGWEESEWIAALPLGGRLAWVLLIGHVKTRGIGGRAKAPSISIIARKWDIPQGDVEAMIRAAVEDGALLLEDGEWVLTAWARYQEPDLTATERKRRERASRNSATNGDSHAVTTVTHRDSTVTRHATETLTLTETETDEKPSAPPPAREDGREVVDLDEEPPGPLRELLLTRRDATSTLVRMRHPGGFEATLTTLRAGFLYADEAGAEPDPCVRGRSPPERLNLVARALVEMRSAGRRDWSSAALAGFIRGLERRNANGAGAGRETGGPRAGAGPAVAGTRKPRSDFK